MTNNRDTVVYIIVCWNNKDIVKECIQSIIDQDYKHKRIILIDNDSNDQSAEFVESTFPEVEVLRQNGNLGFARGNNVGIDYALQDDTVQYIALVNTDARIGQDWTTTLVNFAETQPQPATLQTITLDYYDHNVVDSTHIYISRNGQGTQGSYRRLIDDKMDVMPMKTFGCNAAAMLITRKFIEAQPFRQFFDEPMFMYLEDVDVAARATVMGWDNFIVPGSRAYHMGSASSGKSPGFSLHLTFRNNTRLLFVNLPFLLFLKIMPSVFSGDRETIRHLKIMGKHDAAEKVRKGRMQGLVRLPLAIPRAVRMSFHRNIKTSDLWLLMKRGF